MNIMLNLRRWMKVGTHVLGRTFVTMGNGILRSIQGSAESENFVIAQNSIIIEDACHMWDIFDKSKIHRVIDAGCHKGEHIANILKQQLPNAEIVGVDPKISNYQECLKFQTDKISFRPLDCRMLSRDNVGAFDLVWCFGLIYHLDDPTALMKAIKRITHSESVVYMETHIAVFEEQAHMPDPNGPIIEKVLDGQVYCGKVYPEFDSNFSDEQKDCADQAAFDNPWSFWLTYESIITKLRISNGTA